MSEILKDFFKFLEHSPSPWHAAHEITTRLLQEGFISLDENDRWDLHAEGKYFVQRGGSLVAFCLPKKTPSHAVICASHTDSPCLKIKPHAEFRSHNMNLFRIESYGGPLLSTWFDRDLALAGQVYVDDEKKITQHLVFTKDHPMTIPSLAIHLQEKKDGVPIQYLNKQDHLCPLIGLSDTEQNSLEKIIKSHIKHEAVLGYDLYLVPTQAPTFLGSSKELIGAYRLDNLSSAHASLRGLIEAKTQQESTISMTAFWNHEEIGSHSREGAASPFLEEVIKRICLSLKINEEDFLRIKNKSLCVSLDVAHGFHPNFKDRYDPQDHPLLGHGIIIKQNANMLYASTAHSIATITHLCQKNKIPYQLTASHSEIRGGSSVGPIASTAMGITTVDIGSALLAMHSTRELISTEDHLTLCKFTKILFEKG
ncbi:MAG: M18 family aminopeptidase [Chlamydiota bacterium]